MSERERNIILMRSLARVQSAQQASGIVCVRARIKNKKSCCDSQSSGCAAIKCHVSLSGASSLAAAAYPTHPHALAHKENASC